MARPKLGEGETERLHVKITSEELSAIDDWRYGNRVPSRSEAVRRLVQMGIQADGSLEQIRAQAEGTYEFIALRIESHLKEFKEVKNNEEWSKHYLALVKMCVDTMQMVGNLGSTVRQASDQSNTMKGDEDVAKLIAKAKDVAREYDITRERFRKMRAPYEDNEK